MLILASGVLILASGVLILASGVLILASGVLILASGVLVLRIFLPRSCAKIVLEGVLHNSWQDLVQDWL